MDKEKSKILEIVRMALMLGTIMALVWTTTTLIKNKDIIQKDPLRYGMDVHGFVSCACYDEEGKDWYSSEEGFIHEESGVGFVNYSFEEDQINYSKFEVGENRKG